MRDGFHWQDGWYFRRMEDGSVEVTKTREPLVASPPALQFVIPPAEWASIVCSVSAEGESGERWNTAQDFHGRTLQAHDAPKLEPRDPNPLRTGIFRDHNCWKCDDGSRPCVQGNPRQCEYLHARND